MAGIAQGEPRALEEIHRRYAGPIFGLALRVLHTRELAEEVVQTVLTRLWSHPELFDSARGSLRSFLLTMAHNRAVDLVRSEQARRARHERYAVPSPTYDLEEEVLDAEALRKVREAIEGLSEGERSAVTLAYLGGHTYREVARVLGLPEGTVKSRIRSGLARLRSGLNETACRDR